MPYSLKGKNVLVTGGSRGLGALICEKFAAEGCNVVVNYNASAERAQAVVDKIQKQHGIKAFAIGADAAIVEDNVKLVKETVQKLGGLDIVIANAGFTRFAKFGDINDLTNDEWQKCWAVNVIAHLTLHQQIMPIFEANPEGGAYIITSSVAGITQGGSSMGYSVTKAAGLHLMKCLATTQGKKLRINAVLPGLLLTEWGLKYPEEALEANKQRAILKRETDLDDCANMFISIAQNNSMTGQQIVVDAGLVVK